MSEGTVIGKRPKDELCGSCAGDGYTEPGELYEQDPLWYGPDDIERCHECAGAGGTLLCASTPEWCEANPLPGRNKMFRHTPEWYPVSKHESK